MARAPRTPIDTTRYGVGEWFGTIVATANATRRQELAAKSVMNFKAADMPCPFRQASDKDAKCNKVGGVCTLRPYTRTAGKVAAGDPFVTLCPSRFWQDNAIFRWIGQDVLGVSNPTLIKEVEFLEGLTDDAGEGGDAVGRIDTVLIDPHDRANWCALELQAVYFSGPGMPSHLAQYAAPAGTQIEFPDKTRRPDFRSSGPKRLMPQLQTKVPTLRRWGRKMAVVVDKPFFASLGKLIEIPHLSNSDIAWFVVEYDPASGAISLAKKVYTTLESSVEALTAGIPRSRESFEEKLAAIETSTAPQMVKKVIRL